MTLPSSHEIALLRRARHGDEDAFDEIVQRYTTPLYRVVRRMSGDAMEAESITQETFIRLWRALPRYRTDKPLLPYLITIATNLYRDMWRKAQRTVEEDIDEMAEWLSAESDDPEDHLLQEEVLAQLARAVESLPPHYRTVIALRYDAGWSYQQIAEALDLPLNTVRTHLRRAKATLRKYLEQETHANALFAVEKVNHG